jgi:hypothetical protein
MKILAGICCLASMLTLTAGVGAAPPVGGPPGLTGLFPNLAAQPFVPATPPAVLPSASRVTAPLANPIGTTLNPPGLLPAPLSGPGPTVAPPSNGSTGGPPEFDHTVFVQSPPVVPGSDQDPASGDWRRLPTCK